MTKGKKILYSKGRMKRIKLLLILIFISPLWAKDYLMKFPSSFPEKPQKPKIDFQTLVEKSELPIELRNFRIKEEAEKEKKLVIKGIPKHILEDKGNSFYISNQRTPEGLNIKLDFFPTLTDEPCIIYEGSIFTIGFSADDTKLNVFSGFLSLPFNSTVWGGNLRKEFGLNTFYFSLLHRKNSLTKNPSGLYNFSLLTDFEISKDLKLLFDFDYIHLYNNSNTLDSLNPKMEIAFNLSKSWLFKGGLSYSSHYLPLEIDDYPFLVPSSNICQSAQFSRYTLFFSLYRFLFSDFSIGMRFSYNDIKEPVTEFPFLEKTEENGSAVESALIFSRERGSGIRFSLSSGVLIPSLFFTFSNLPINDSTPSSPLIFTFSSVLKGELEFSGTSFEISYNWASFPYVSLSLKDIYSSKILLEQEIPLSKIIGGNIAIVIELRNLINFLKPPVREQYLLIFYPRWIRGGVEIQF